MRKILFPFLLLLTTLVQAQQTLPVIPAPARLDMRDGRFVIDPKTTLRFDAANPELRRISGWFSDAVHRISGIRLASQKPGGKAISLKLKLNDMLGAEGYRLDVTPSQINIEASGPAGVFYALQSVLQTLPGMRTNAALVVPCMSVEDKPRFGWRGLHLDVSRHFFGPEVIKQYIDLMARYKMNRFHWHLTDDQGWRMQIDRYPALTDIGAWRVDQNHLVWGSRPQAKPGQTPDYGGFYTKQQLRELVAYARDRNVVIVPEIEMPGHSAAAVAAYPNLSCARTPQLPMTGGDYKGISSNFCAGNDSVFTFLEGVLTEVMDVFPSQYIHIGGDEVDKGPWKKCDRCQARMKKEGLKTEEELQSWFIRRIEKFIVANKRRMIGWDEILEGGLAPTATVMSWRGEAGGIEAAKMDHDVVMTPGSPCYFDHYQAGPDGEPRAIGGMNTLRKVYDYEPVPAELAGDRAKYVLGAQANVWTEFITTPEHLEYMILPRMPALSEVLWSPKDRRNWPDFNTRLQSHLNYFRQNALHHSNGNFTVQIKPVPQGGKLMVSLSTEAYRGEIRYTLDGSEPTVSSNKYEGPFPVSASGELKAVTVLDGEVMGTRAARQSFSFHLGTGATVKYREPNSGSYPASGPMALADGIRGVHGVGSYWHGFPGRDLEATLDMGSTKEIKRIALGCMQRYNDWIFMPASVRFEISDNGTDFTEIGLVQNPVSQEDRNSVIKDFEAKFAARKARYVRVTAKAIPGIPKGHPGEGKPAWIFADEIVIE